MKQTVINKTEKVIYIITNYKTQYLSIYLSIYPNNTNYII